MAFKHFKVLELGPFSENFLSLLDKFGFGIFLYCSGDDLLLAENKR